MHLPLIGIRRTMHLTLGIWRGYSHSGGANTSICCKGVRESIHLHVIKRIPRGLLSIIPVSNIRVISIDPILRIRISIMEYKLKTFVIYIRSSLVIIIWICKYRHRILSIWLKTLNLLIEPLLFIVATLGIIIIISESNKVVIII